MILYTVVPQDVIYQSEQKEFEKQKMAMYNGIPVIVEATEDNQYEVVRIVSSDPNDYLQSTCIPGTKIKL